MSLMKRNMSQYELDILLERVQRAAHSDKKTPGIGRTIRRLISDMISGESAIAGLSTIDFTISLEYYNLSENTLVDWYARLKNDHPVLAEKHAFERDALNVMYKRWVWACAEAGIYGEHSLIEFVVSPIFRWQQVTCPDNPAESRVIPVITIPVPEDLDTWSLTRKLKFMELLYDLAKSGELNYLSSMFGSVQESRQYRDELVVYTDSLHARVSTDSTQKLLAWECNPKEFFTGYSLLESTNMLVPSSYAIRPEAIFLDI